MGFVPEIDDEAAVRLWSSVKSTYAYTFLLMWLCILAGFATGGNIRIIRLGIVIFSASLILFGILSILFRWPVTEWLVGLDIHEGSYASEAGFPFLLIFGIGREFSAFNSSNPPSDFAPASAAKEDVIATTLFYGLVFLIGGVSALGIAFLIFKA